MQDKDFLQGYEITPWDYNSRAYKILGASVLINALMIFVIGQTNMLAQSACESPFVDRVCQVLDTVYVSSKLLTTDAGYVVKEYEETRIADANVYWVDQTNVEPKMDYPEGYFQIANRDELAMLDYQDIPGLPNEPVIIPTPDPILPPPPVTRRGGSLLDNQKLPKQRDDITDGDLPDDPLGNRDDDGGTVAGTNTKDPIDKNTARGSDPLPEVQINQKPIDDFVDAVDEKVRASKVNLRDEFRVVMNAFLDDDGRLDPERSKWLPEREEGDPEMILVAKDAVEKIGDSGWLIYLSNEDIKNFHVIFFQDDEELAAQVVAIMPSENRAKRVASGFRTLKQARLALHNNGTSVMKEDEVTLLNAAEIVSENNLLKINFSLKKDVAHGIIDTRLKQYQVEKDKKRLQAPASGRPNGAVDNGRANGKVVER